MANLILRLHSFFRRRLVLLKWTRKRSKQQGTFCYEILLHNTKLGFWCALTPGWMALCFMENLVILTDIPGRYCCRFSGNWQTKDNSKDNSTGFYNCAYLRTLNASLEQSTWWKGYKSWFTAMSFSWHYSAQFSICMIFRRTASVV